MSLKDFQSNLKFQFGDYNEHVAPEQLILFLSSSFDFIYVHHCKIMWKIRQNMSPVNCWFFLIQDKGSKFKRKRKLGEREQISIF